MKIYKVSCTYYRQFDTEETEYFQTIKGLLNYLSREYPNEFIITDKIKHEIETEKYITIKPEKENYSCLYIDALNTDDMK